ncbi:BgTH12-02491 [Blumeria graminis f. sp. triticale]|nr:BgTH12-02491 [Blumeria graminis f. sp. triticale]
MRRPPFNLIGLLLNTFSQLLPCSASPSSQGIEYVYDIKNNYVCDNFFFGSDRVRRSYITGCNELWNDNLARQFPARLEDKNFVGRIQRTLFSWPLKNSVDSSDIRSVGDYRTVFDIYCRFYGVIIRGKTSHSSCIELSDSIDTNVISPGSNIYRGYKCQTMMFRETYVQASLKQAKKTKLKRSRLKKYPVKVSRPGEDGDAYEWPLFPNNIIYKSYGILNRHLKYFASYSDVGHDVQVYEKSKYAKRECPLMTKTIVSGTRHSNSISPHERVVHDEKKSYDCSGQIFTDYYIQEVNTMMRNVISGRYYSEFKNYYYRSVNILKIDAINKVWAWNLRVPETEFQNSGAIISYILAMNQAYQMVGIYQVMKGEYAQCSTKYESTGSSTNSMVSDLDLNQVYSPCKRCKDDTGCSCEENWHDPKRQKTT